MLEKDQLDKIFEILQNIDLFSKKISSELEKKVDDDKKFDLAKSLESKYQARRSLIEELEKTINLVDLKKIAKEKKDLFDNKIKSILAVDRKNMEEIDRLLKNKASDVKRLAKQKSLLIYMGGKK